MMSRESDELAQQRSSMPDGSNINANEIDSVNSEGRNQEKPSYVPIPTLQLTYMDRSPMERRSDVGTSPMT